jgi:sarcosine oxidase, subunit gamma
MADPRPGRRGPLDGLAAPRGAVLSALPAESRFSFRAGESAARAAGEAFGVRLPETACRAAARDGRAALWLGPDEWLLLAPANEGAEIAAAIVRALEGPGQEGAGHEIPGHESPGHDTMAHALVDIGHRAASIGIDGPDSTAVLNAGCPLDLDPGAFPVGMCTRTVFAKAGIVLWRRGMMRFRLDVARSFAPYVWRLLEEARREFLR